MPVAPFIQLQPAPSIGESLGSGLGAGISQAAQLSLANKMSMLNQQRQMQQALALRDYEANIMQKGGYGRLAELHRAGIPLKDVVAQYPNLLMNDKEVQEQQNIASASPKRQMFEQFNEMIPIQDREAIEEPQEMATVQQFRQRPVETQVQEKMQPEAQEVGPSGLKKDFLQQAQQELNVEKHPFKSLPKDLQNRVMNRARQISEEFYKEKNLKLAERKQEYKEQEPVRKFEEEAQNKIKAWHKQKNNLQFIAEHAREIGSHAGIRKKISETFGIPIGELLNPTEQVMDKIATQLAQNISSIFPGRVLVSELEAYMRSNPSLLNDPIAMENIAKIMLESGKMAEEEYKSIRSLKKIYLDQGDLFEEVEKVMAPKYDSINEKINQIIGTSEPSSTILMINPKGEIGSVPKEKVEAAKKAGYKLK